MADLGTIESVCTALQLVWKIAVQLKNSGKDIAAAENSIRGVKNELILLKARMEDPKSPFGKADSGITAILKEDIQVISEGVAQAQVILEQRLKIPSWEVGSKIAWKLYQIPNLKIIIASFDSSTTHISKVVTTFLHTDAFAAAADRDKKLKTQLDKLIKDQKKTKQSHDEELKKWRIKLDIRIKLMKEKGPKVVEDAAIHAGSEKPNAWVQELVSGGTRKSEAQKVIDEILKDIKEEHDQTQAEAKASDTKKRTDTESMKILCVDSNNGARAVMAQVYLELLRSWTMNTQKRWLFHSVESAGSHIPNSFTTPHLPPQPSSWKEGNPLEEFAITTVEGEEAYFWSSEDPYEKSSVTNRIKTQKVRGIQKTDFATYDYILCFSGKNSSMLNKLKDAIATEKSKNGGRAPKAKIHQLPNCSWVFAKNRVEKTYKEYLQNLCGRLKFQIKFFLKNEFAWERSRPSIARGDWRTSQLVVGKGNRKLKVDESKGMKFGDTAWWRVWKQLIKDVEGMTGCVVNLELEKNDGLVSVSGPRDKLKGARKMVLDE